MICSTCGSSEFSTHDGIFYCMECSTQIKGTYSEQTDDYRGRRQLRSPIGKKIYKGKRKAHIPCIEAFNFIIYEQVSALIRLGASPKLKPTVLHIWFKYLQKSQAAFTKCHATESIPCSEIHSTERDLKGIHEDKFLSRKENKSKKLQDTVCKKGLARKNMLYEVRNMNLMKTLSICYLGLLYTKDQLSLLDLIRFVNDGRIPYINIIDKLPPSMNIRSSDVTVLLTYQTPDAHLIHKTSREIAMFLNLPKYKEPSLYCAVSRYVKDLNLPADIQPMVKVLAEQFEKEACAFQSLNSEEMPHDYLAVAFIIVVLKMLFVLDGRFEIEHGKVMTKLNILNPDHKYFVWADWKEQALLREFLFLPDNPWHCPVNNIDSLCADRIISKYFYTHLKPPSDGDLPSCRKYLVSKHNVKNMLSSIVHIPSSDMDVPSSFPVRSKINSFTKEWRALKMFKRTKDIDFTLLCKDFSSHSLCFNPLHFKKEDNQLSYLLLTSLYLSERSTETHFHLLKYCISAHKIIRTSTKYWFLNSRMKSDRSDAVSDWIDEVPSSFKWLITYILNMPI